MDDPAGFVENSDRLVAIFGHWPSFHDAEIIEFNLWRGDIRPEADRWIPSALTAKIHLCDMRPAVDQNGCHVPRRPARVTMRFHSVDNFKAEGFSHQNAIYDMSVVQAEPAEGQPRTFRVAFAGAQHGITSSFHCERIEVIEAESVPPEA